MKNFNILFVIASAIFISGCSAYMAAKQPEKKDPSVLETGTHRYEVIAELGTPLITEKKEENTVDVFKFIQGYGTGHRTLRAVGHGIASLYTLGLWELAGTSIEGTNDGKEIKLKVTYDKEDKVENVEIFKGSESFGEQLSNQEKQ